MTAERNEGYLEWARDGETYKTWYYTLGDPSVTGKLAPVIILHGGPSCPNPYMVPHEDLHVSSDRTDSRRPVIFYDQVGGGKSTHLPDKGVEFWTVDLFMDELEHVLAHFGLLQDGGKPYDIVGHSWGGMLAAEWASSLRPSSKALRKLVIADTPASVALWEKAANELLDRYPEVRDVIKPLERAGNTKSEEYQKLLKVYYDKHACTLDPWPKELVASLEEMAKDTTVTRHMHGTAEFEIKGSLKTWDIIDRLSNISVPTLIINGKDDGTQDACVEPFVKLIKDVRWKKFQKSSHMPFWEERKEYMTVVSGFLEE